MVIFISTYSKSKLNMEISKIERNAPNNFIFTAVLGMLGGILKSYVYIEEADYHIQTREIS